MPAPINYDESALRSYVLVALGNVGAALGWTNATPQVTEAVYDAIYAYGPTDTTVTPPTYDVALMTDMRKLRAFAKREAWKQAADATAAWYDIGADGQSLKRSQMSVQAERRYNAAYAEADAYDSFSNTILGATLRPAGTPYASEAVGSEFA